MKKYWLIILFIFTNLYSEKLTLSYIKDISASGLVATDAENWIVYDKKFNKLTVYDYYGSLIAVKEPEFLQIGEDIDCVVSIPTGGFYFFCNLAKKIYQTDSNLKVVNSIILDIDRNVRLSSIFYMNSLQNLVFYDKKNGDLYMLVQSKMIKLWSESSILSDIDFANGKIYMLQSDKIIVKSENGIRFTDLVLKNSTKKIAIAKNTIYGINNGKLFAILNNREYFDKFDIDLNRCTDLQSSGDHLICQLEKKIIILKINNVRNND